MTMITMRPLSSWTSFSPTILYFPATIALLFLCFLRPPAQVAGQENSLINRTCKALARNDPNIGFNFCKTSLEAAPASHCATLKGIGMISIRLIRYNVTDTRCYVKRLLNNSNSSSSQLDPYVRQCLDTCFELYSDAIDSVKKAMKAYNSKLFQDANIQISSIIDSATTCEDGFNDKKGLVSPLTKRNNDTFQLSAIGLSVMNLIRGTSD